MTRSPSRTFPPTLALLLAACTAVPAVPASQAPATEEPSPWWRREKINFMWGQWGQAGEDKSLKVTLRELPPGYFDELAQAGATVFAEHWSMVPSHARRAKAAGLRYFACLNVCRLGGVSSEGSEPLPPGRYAITAAGERNHWRRPTCPLDRTVYEAWIVKPHLAVAREGLLDGLQFDWEYYAGGGEAEMPCYCEDCFGAFLRQQSIDEPLPEPAARYPRLEAGGLTGVYAEAFSQRRIAMFTEIREQLQAANPDLLFSTYGTMFSDFTRAMNTPRTPLIFLDARHYYNDDRQAWWESYSARLKREGYLYIPGGWANALFGAQASQVSAARWIYEAAVNEDGVWVWFERELDDEILRAFATAHRQIKAVEGAVGPFLFQGTRDDNFVTAVEWTGRPELQRAVHTRTHHLGDEHLVHVNNVHTEWPVRVRLRFPRLAGTGPWTVRDAMHGLAYRRDDETPVWTREDLLAGVVVALDPRSDLFLSVSPAGQPVSADRARSIRAPAFNRLPGHATASQRAAPRKAMIRLYYMRNAVFGEGLDGLLASARPVGRFPKAEWRFKGDLDDLGAGEQWFLPDSPLDDWGVIEIESHWGDRGKVGPHWYRRDVDIPDPAPGERVFLHFEGVDEQLVLWIDGAYAGDYNRGPDGWDQPFAIDVTDKLAAGRHHLAMRVTNTGGGGGVWKPVNILAATHAAGSPAPGAAAPGTATHGLLYTATESMGFEGAEGGLTLGNAIRTVQHNDQEGVRLRQLRGHLWSPRYSPDGQAILFVHDAGGRGQLYSMDARGENARNLSANEFCDRAPVWSPDGTRIAFVSDRTGDWDVHLMHADGSDQRHLAGNPGVDCAPAWSPDGDSIAWESHGSGTPTIWVVDADGGNPRPLVSPNRPVVQEVADNQRDSVFNFIGGRWSFADNTFHLTAPAWSPDGTRIAARALGDYNGSMLVIVDADGTRMRQLIRSIPGVGNICWSPDGELLAATWRTAPQESERSGILVIKADGTDENRQGRWLVDVAPQGPRRGGARRHGLNTWYAHGSAQPRRVVKTFSALAWSPDGDLLAFTSDMSPDGAFHVYTVPPGGGEPRRLEMTRSAWPNAVCWQPLPPPGTPGRSLKD